MDKFIYALGIRHIGITAASLLACHVKTKQGLIDVINNFALHQDDIKNIDGFGEQAVVSLEQYFSSQAEHLNNLINCIDLQDAKLSNQNNNGILAGSSIVFTGSLTTMSRAEAKARAEALGAKVLGAISSNVDIVVHGDKAGKKLAKAKELGLRLMPEQEYLMLK